jgi:hypothetical protein
LIFKDGAHRLADQFTRRICDLIKTADLTANPVAQRRSRCPRADEGCGEAEPGFFVIAVVTKSRATAATIKPSHAVVGEPLINRAPWLGNDSLFWLSR